MRSHHVRSSVLGGHFLTAVHARAPPKELLAGWQARDCAAVNASSALAHEEEPDGLTT